MIRISSLAVPLSMAEQDWLRLAAAALSIYPASIKGCILRKQSVDARKKDAVHFVLTLDITVEGDEADIIRHSRHKGVALVQASAPFQVERLSAAPKRRPIVVGSGPAGLFAALTLAQAGAMPLLIERGRDAQTRKRDVDAYWAGGPLDAQSNVQFGEGGAGTFSDGKLNTGIKDPRCRAVLEAFVAHGAPESILWQAKPHIGTDNLIRVVQNMRASIEALGGQVCFQTQLTALHIERDTLTGAVLGDAEVTADAVALCIGHSARDTYAMLQKAGVHMEAKPFSIGARIEHLQAMVDRRQYGRFAGHPALGAADYKLSAHLANGRGVYTFCMCPGGVVVAAASEAGTVATNGMSYHARDGMNANSALLVDVRPEDYGGEADPLAGIRYQAHWEKLACVLGGSCAKAPVQRVEDFLARRPSMHLGEVMPTYKPGVTPADLGMCLPEYVADGMREGIVQMDRRLQGFAHPDAVLTGVETRSSAPVRILRDETGQANIRGLFPAGEGAGYAGGITSAAVDGIRTAEKILAIYARREDGR